ncbi:MAG: hypothetical protein V3S55_09525 [Nitrospiraceae bacterium]
MANPRKETTYPVRLRESSYGLACRISEQYSMSLIDAVAAGMLAWEMLTEEQKAEITGAAHDTEVFADEDDDEGEEEAADFYVMRS